MTIIFQVDDSVFEKHPDYIVGCVLARGILAILPADEIEAALAESEQATREHFAGRDPKDDPSIAVWRSVFSASGWSASKYPASIEALVKRVAKGANLPRINPSVDLANVAALRFLVPVGTHDVASFAGSPLTVRHSTSDDTFAPMGDAAAEAPDPEEIVYAVGTTVRTRRWVWRQSRDALVDASASELFFPVDGFTNVTADGVRRAVEIIEALATGELGASVTTGFVARDEPTFTG